MKQLILGEQTGLLRFDRGEDFIPEFTKYCKTHEIAAATFTGLGAAKEITVAYYNIKTKQYEDQTFSENVEILNLNGNIAMMDTKYIIHCHGIFGRKDLSTIGGHVKKLIISATCEVTLTFFNEPLNRKFDKTTGLNLLS